MKVFIVISLLVRECCAASHGESTYAIVSDYHRLGPELDEIWLDKEDALDSIYRGFGAEMIAHRVTAFVVLASISLLGSANAKSRLRDAQVKQRIIKASISEYSGNCPCPYNSASNGSRCGRRSAWNRAGGYAPMCFASDVTMSDVKAWRASH
jgi:hypothetical protein